MDRAAKLATYAKAYVAKERRTAVLARETTRELLADDAIGLGFAPNEISSAIDQALKDAGVGP